MHRSVRGTPRSRLVSLAALGWLALAGIGARAGQLPDVVVRPRGINLGSTSFFDGFGRLVEGFTLLQYGQFRRNTRIANADGAESAYFASPRIEAFVSQTQVAYTSSWHPFGGGVGIVALLPVIGYAAHFAADSPVKLTHDDVNIGDMNVGVFYQARPILAAGRPIFSWRAQASFTAPTGGFDTHRDINQSAGYWQAGPYVAWTWLPAPRLEISSRLNYQYNFRTSMIADPPPIPHLVYRNGQAGQITYGNLDMSYALRPHVYLGVNAYGLCQLTADRTNGAIVPRSRSTAVAAGPGGRIVFDAANALNANLYLPIMTRNGDRGLQVNYQFVHRF